MHRPARLLAITGGLMLLPACWHTWSHHQEDEMLRPKPRAISVREIPTHDSELIQPPPELSPAPKAEHRLESVPRKVSMEPPLQDPAVAAPDKPPEQAAPEVPSQAASADVSPASPMQHPIVLAVHEFLEGRPEKALEHLSGYPSEDQEMLLQLVPVITGVDKSKQHAGVASQKKQVWLNTLNDFSAKLRSSASLEIEQLMFCEQVKGYGKVRPLATATFRPGDIVCVYVQLQNLTDRQTKEGCYATRLTCHLEIRNASCKVVWSDTPKSAPDESLVPRNDHYSQIELPIKSDLPPGFYTLRVRITDVDTERVADKTLDFRIETMSAKR